MSTEISQLNKLCAQHGFDIVESHAYTTLNTNEKLYCWATVREFPEHGTLSGQVNKLIEEAGELSKALLDRNENEVVDALGDITVVIGVMSVMCNYELDNVLSFVRKPKSTIHKDQVWTCDLPHLNVTLGELAGNVVRKDKLNCYGYLRGVILALDILSSHLNFSLEECFQFAFSEIENRRGKMLHGVWVKEKDL